MKSLTACLNTRALTVLFGMVLLCVIWGGLYVKVQSERQLELDNAARETANYARAFEEHTLRTLQGLDQIALFLKHQAEAEGLALDLPRLVSEEKFANQPFLHLGISDENGNATASSQSPFIKVSARELEHFLVHKDVDSGKLFIGKPLIGRTTEKWSIQLTRRINKPDGSFGGVVYVAVDPNYFLDFYKQVNLGPHSSIALFGRDGIVRVRQSENEVQLGLDYNQRILANMSTSEAGSFSAVAVADGVKRIYSYRAMRDYPLYLTVGVSEEYIFANLNRRIIVYYWACSAISVLILLFVFLLLAGIARRTRAEEELVNSERRLNRAQSIAHVGDWEIDIGNKQVWASAEAFRIYGITQNTPYLSLQTIQQIVHSSDRPKLNKALEGLLEKNEKYEVEFKIHRALDGLEKTIHSIAELQHDKNGKPVKIVGILQDITDRKQAEKALSESKSRREQEITRDAQLATRMQSAMLSAPESSEYIELTTLYKPFGYVGGDLYFMDWRLEGSLLRGFLVDAAGHGLSTALHTTSLHVLLREVNEHDLPLSDAMQWINRRAGEYFDEGVIAGALGFELDLQTQQLRWVCAGITKIMVATKTKQGLLECPGMCLGISEHETFETHTMPIEIGDCFYFLTDGLTDLLEGLTNLPMERYPAMVELLRGLSECETRRDDATAVCLHVRSLPQSFVRQDGWPRVLRFNGYVDYQRLRGEVVKILTEVTGRAHSLAEVAVNEAIANALECRDGQSRSQKARLRFNRVGNWFIVRVKTSRIGFAGNAILRRLRANPENMFTFGEDAAMGRGIPMMLSMSHKMTYNSEGTEVLLAWRQAPDFEK